jgi:hypothetical protein
VENCNIDEKLTSILVPKVLLISCKTKSAACRPAAELASFWNKPIISWVATDPDFNDKTVFTTLARTLGPFHKMGAFIAEIFKQYNWRKVVVISSNYFIWLDAGKAIRKASVNSLFFH